MPLPESTARLTIDAAVASAGWRVQDLGAMDISAGLAVAVREFVLAAGHGRADYALYVLRRCPKVTQVRSLNGDPDDDRDLAHA